VDAFAKPIFIGFHRDRWFPISIEFDAINVAEDIHSFTTFKRNSSDLLKRMKKTGRPLVLTINGKAEAVVLDPTIYQQVADHLDVIARIRRGLAQAKRGEGQTVDGVFDELESEP
jgi:prevent-host-death family protein